MTNRLEINWTVDGDPDEHRYYCSETAMDVNSLPPPKAVLSGSARSYTDTAVVQNKTYYVIIGSVKNGVQKLSVQKQSEPTEDLYWSSVTSLLHFNGANNSTTFTDQKANTWAKTGFPVISTEKSKFGGSSGKFSKNNYISTSNMSGFLFGATEDFTLEAWLYVPNGTSIFQQKVPILTVGLQNTLTDGGGYNFSMLDKANATIQLQRGATNGTVQNAEISIGSALPRDVWMHIELGRSSGTVYGFFNGNLAGTSTAFNNIPLNSPNVNKVSIASGDSTTSNTNLWYLAGFIDDLRVTKGVCRHTASFTPPAMQLPDK